MICKTPIIICMISRHFMPANIRIKTTRAKKKQRDANFIEPRRRQKQMTMQDPTTKKSHFFVFWVLHCSACPLGVCRLCASRGGRLPAGRPRPTQNECVARPAPAGRATLSFWVDFEESIDELRAVFAAKRIAKTRVVFIICP